VAKAKGGLVTVAGKIDRLEIAGVTACQFDRKSGNEHMLYVVTDGGLGGPVNGSEVEAGRSRSLTPRRSKLDDSAP
jgi:hypothetical protein